MESKAIITALEREAIEKKCGRLTPEKNDQFRSDLDTLFSEEKDLQAYRKRIRRIIIPKINLIKSGEIKLSPKERSELHPLSKALSNLEEKLIPNASMKIKSKEREWGFFKAGVKNKIQQELSDLENTKNNYLKLRNAAEHKAKNLKINDVLLLFVVEKIKAPNLLLNLNSDHLSQLRLENPDIKLGVITSLSIRNLMNDFSSYFKKVAWNAIRSFEDYDDSKIEATTLASIAEELNVPFDRFMIISDSLEILSMSTSLGLRSSFWGDTNQINRGSWFNDPDKIAIWVRDPSKLRLPLELAVENKQFSNGEQKLVPFKHGNIIILGRYFKKWSEEHLQIEGSLSRCLLRAKGYGYPPELIEGLAEILQKFSKGTWITAVPDKEGKFSRMTKLLSALKKNTALAHLNFSDSFLTIKGNFKLTELNKTEREKKINEAMHGKNADLSNCEVVVIDDICTTGSTLTRAYECLKYQGATNVHCVALAHTI